MAWKDFRFAVGFGDLVSGLIKTVTEDDPLPVTGSLTIVDSAELTERMLNLRPADGYKLWFDPIDASHKYIMEAPAGTAASATGFRGIRVTQPTGVVETNIGGTLTFDNRTTDPDWLP